MGDAAAVSVGGEAGGVTAASSAGTEAAGLHPRTNIKNTEKIRPDTRFMIDLFVDKVWGAVLTCSFVL
ncbi:MAG: hypothetical protein DPW18_08785 [Chloroflexi bacterium]|nr:hypothetical protein [Chloroflexota bacterium]